MSEPRHELDTRPGRRPGPAMRAFNLVVPGVRRVRAQGDPYAQAWWDASRDALARGGRRWVVLGDSMSQGVGASAYDAGWVGRLATRLRADGHDLAVVNLSATGARTTDVLERQLPAMQALPAPTDGAGPDLVTVLVGSNDLFGGRAARAALPDAMAELVDRLPDGAVIATLPQPSAAARAANVPIDRAGESGRLHVVDMRRDGPESWRGKVASDFFHPNDVGYEAITDAVDPVVRRALRDLAG